MIYRPMVPIPTTQVYYFLDWLSKVGFQTNGLPEKYNGPEAVIFSSDDDKILASQ